MFVIIHIIKPLFTNAVKVFGTLVQYLNVLIPGQRFNNMKDLLNMGFRK
ncbi:unnamed protein product, partial [marine sediment metagenome]